MSVFQVIWTLVFQISNSWGGGFFKKMSNVKLCKQKIDYWVFINKHIKSQILQSFLKLKVVISHCQTAHVGAKTMQEHKVQLWFDSLIFIFIHFHPAYLILHVFWLQWMQAISPAVMTLALSIVVYMFRAQQGEMGWCSCRRPRCCSPLVNQQDVSPRAVWRPLGMKGGMRSSNGVVLHHQIIDEHG